MKGEKVHHQDCPGESGLSLWKMKIVNNTSIRQSAQQERRLIAVRANKDCSIDY